MNIRYCLSASRIREYRYSSCIKDNGVNSFLPEGVFWRQKRNWAVSRKEVLNPSQQPAIPVYRKLGLVEPVDHGTFIVPLVHQVPGCKIDPDLIPVLQVDRFQ
jgi:hypothetical protein